MKGWFDDLVLDDQDQPEVLDLNPDRNVVKPRTDNVFLDMGKQRGWEEKELTEDDLDYWFANHDLWEWEPKNPKYLRPQGFKFDQKERFNPDLEDDNRIHEELVLNPDVPKKVKGGIIMEKQEERFKPEPEHKDPWRAERVLTEMVADYDKIDDPIRPNKQGGFFDRQAKIDHSKKEAEEKWKNKIDYDDFVF